MFYNSFVDFVCLFKTVSSYDSRPIKCSVAVQLLLLFSTTDS